jgi:hypothetical protein
MGSNENRLQKKIVYAPEASFKEYLKKYNRQVSLPIMYEMLKDFADGIALYDVAGKNTLWETVFYHPALTSEIHAGLKRIYSLLKASGYTQAEDHLQIERIDYCLFGNSKPFRVKIINKYNDVYDYFYIKIADASRLFGLELEHLIAPFWINFLVDQNTLVEEHIAGIPGDMFIDQYLNREAFNPKKIAKEFVKFNERCFIRLLGDMRSYNFVFDITQDFDDIQFRIRPIDFDQQSYEGRKNLYLPQFFKENKVFVDLVSKHLNANVINQYQQEERSQIARRIDVQQQRINDLMAATFAEKLSTEEKIKQLATELAAHYHNDNYLLCNTMPQLVLLQLMELIKLQNQ